MESGSPPPLPPRPTNGRIVSHDDAPAGVAAVTKQSRLALASLVFGVLACPFFGLTGIPGLICGVMGLRQIEASQRPGSPVRYTGKSLAITGIVVSGMMPFIWVYVGIAWVQYWVQYQTGWEAGICANHFDGIGLAFHNAASTNNQLMPLAIVDADGRPLLSWRVALLPFIGQEQLHREFHLDEPWDSPHNILLLPRMPEIYACPSSPIPPSEGITLYVAAAGPGMFFDAPEPIPGTAMIGVPLSAIHDGTSNTILVLESGRNNGVPWTSPQEMTVDIDEAIDVLREAMTVDIDKAIDALREAKTNHFFVVRTILFGDGSVREISQQIDATTLRALFTRDAGDVVTPF